MGADFGEVRQLAVDLAKGLKLTDVEAVVKRGAVNIKDQLRAEMGASGHFGQAARSITFDMRGYAAAEIGPESKGAGKLENIAYFGGVNGGGGTVPDPRGALEAEAPNFERELAKLAEDYLK